MTTTTLALVRAAIETTIRGLDPTGTPLGQARYRVASKDHSWDARAATDSDRVYTVGDFTRREPMFFGSTSETDYRIAFKIMVGHVLAGNNRFVCQTRRDTDLFQIASELEDFANFPSGVAIVRLNGMSVTEKPDRWITTLTMDAQMGYAI
jgi:hypothetical protein